MVDKQLQREVLKTRGVLMLPDPADEAESRVAIPRWGSGGQGVVALREGEWIDTNRYTVTQFCPGHELSMNLYVGRRRLVAFPPVYKGRTREDLLHPAVRPRIAGMALPGNLTTRLEAMAIKCTQAFSLHGFVEVEFILDDFGRLRIVEVNPRISQSLRPSALSAKSCLCLLGLAEASKSASALLRFDNSRPVVEIPFSPLPETNSSSWVSHGRLTMVLDGADIDDMMLSLGCSRTYTRHWKHEVRKLLQQFDEMVRTVRGSHHGLDPSF
ncbi:ATP-grasp domain-containing protein [Ornithinimicrobium panacihumi]|uniref:ATP-grasp domain-containing protein n=1 Tax=Ornithinimicrobium panacihumi TaxID=2008449 RepID=UPI003F8C0E74